jgi:hypothetical protein
MGDGKERKVRKNERMRETFKTSFHPFLRKGFGGEREIILG